MRISITSYKIALSLLFLGGILWTSDSDQNSKQLDGAHNITFGMSRKEAVASFPDFKPIIEKRKNLTILEYREVPSNIGRADKLRIFLTAPDGVFWIEEQYYLKWDLQKEDIVNLENHQRELRRVLGRLRKKFGRETLSEPAELDARFREYDFVTATWQIADKRWIHVIFEPQDWGIYPELNKIVIIYRDSERDQRKTVPR